MLVKLLPTRIPAFWEVIKSAAVQADSIKEKDSQIYLNNLLNSLLNDKSQCFVRLDGERKLLALMVTKIETSKITGENILSIQSVYSWTQVDSKTWMEDLQFTKKFAKHENCKQIVFESNNSKIWEIAKAVGFKEKTRYFVFSVED